MDPIIIVVLILLLAYPISIFSLNFMFKQKYAKKKMIFWNVFILLVPIVAPIIYFSYYFATKKKVEAKDE